MMTLRMAQITFLRMRPLAPVIYGLFWQNLTTPYRSFAISPFEVSGLQWVFHPLSREFLSDVEAMRKELNAKKLSLSPIIGEYDGWFVPKLFSFSWHISLCARLFHPSVLLSNLTSGDVLSRLRAAFKLRLLTLLANELSGENTAKDIDIVDVSRLLVSISTSNGLPKKENNWDCATMITEGDAMCTWWTHVFTCALLWKQGLREKAKQHYAVVRRCPPELLNSPLALALGHAFCCRKLCIDDRDNVNFGKFVFIHSRKALEQLRMVCARECTLEVSQLQAKLHRLAYEWVMSSLLDAWRQDLEPQIPYWCQHARADYRTLYQEACNHYTHLHLHGGGERGSRLATYQLTSRMLNGANPLHTWTAVCRIRKERYDAVRPFFNF
ncbi:unnamed protein product [Haemonchus placei]|uniref:Sterol regulatory element-binding protein ECM22 n=1 Tax=Haemonchus placei TaxID=6290 RepID=A0A0N4W0E5_HAEPC|nr:unnamed protein product [Haemonchus placei]